MNNLIKITAMVAVLVAVIGCVAVVSDDSDAASEVVYVGGDNASDVTGNGTEASPYATITEGIKNTTSGGTVKLLGNVESVPFMIEKTRINIDLQDHTLTISGTSISSGISFFGVSYQIMNGTIIDERDSATRSGGYTALFIGSGMELTLTDVEVKIYDSLNTSESNNVGIRAEASTLALVDSKITSIPDTDADSGSIGIVALGIGQDDSVKVKLEGTTAISVGQFGISGNGSTKVDGSIVGGDNGVTGSSNKDYRGTNITIGDNAVVEAKNGWGIYHPQGGTLTISDNARVSGLTGIEMRSGTLELNGGTVESTATAFSSKANGSGPTTTGAAIAIVQHSTKLDIDIGIHDGATVSGPTAVYQADLQSNGAEGTDKISIEIDGGEFKSTATGDDAKAVDVQDVTGFISGGNFTGSVPEESVKEGLEIADDGSVTESPFVATVNGIGYYSLEEAFTAAQDRDTIVLLDDATIENVTIAKGIMLNLGGHTLEIVQAAGSTNGIGIDFTGGSSSIVNGAIVDNRSEGNTSCGYIGVRATGSGTSLTVTDVDFVQCIPNSGKNYNYGFRVDAQASLTLGEGFTISEREQVITDMTYGNVGVAIFGNNSGQTTLTIDGADIHTTGFGISGNGANSDGTVINMVGGTVVSDISQGIYHPQDGILNISGGSISGQTGVEMRAGTLNMTGGTVIGNGNPFESDPNGNGSTTTGAGIAVVQHTTKKVIDVNVSNGTVQGFRAVYEKNLQGNEDSDIGKINIDLTGGVFEAINGGTEAVKVVDSDIVTDVVSGGTFNTDVSDYAADGYVVIPDEDGNYGAIESDVSDVIITGSGTYAYETDGTVITIPSDGVYGDVTLDLGFAGVDVKIVGDVTGDVVVSCYPIDPEDMDSAVWLVITGVDGTDMSVTLTIPVTVESGYHIDEDSVYAYSIVDGERVSEEAYASGDSVVIETTHNTPFYVGYEVESDLPPFIPFPPEQGGDPVEVGPIDQGGSSSDGGDNTLKVVAVAAAAVIAAILAIVLASTYRKD